MQITRTDIIGQNGNDGQIYDTKTIDGVVYRKNPTGAYAHYLHTKTGSWRESALVKNEDLNDKLA